MLRKAHGNKKTMFEINKKPNTVVKNEPKTSRVSEPIPKTSAYDRVVQLVTNDNAEAVSQQRPQGQEPQKKKYILWFNYVSLFAVWFILFSNSLNRLFVFFSAPHKIHTKRL